MCWNNSDEFQCVNGAHCGSGDTCLCMSACFVGNYCEIDINAAHLPLTGAVMKDLPTTRDVYIAIFVLFGLVGLVNNILAFTTFIHERIRITSYGVYLILFSIFSILLMITILTYVMKIVRYENETYHLVACNVIPFISVVMSDGGFLFTAAIAFERVLIECFNFNVNGSRMRGLVVSFFIICYVTGSNIDEIFSRWLINDATGTKICTYYFDDYPIWRRLDVVFSYTHAIIPFTLHVLCSICVLTSIARRKVFLHSTEHRFCRVWFEQLYEHRDFFIPPVCIILCMIPHGVIGHLLHLCLPHSDKVKLRLHIFMVFLVFTPPMLNFLLYIYPNDIYWKEFQQTFFYRKLCCYCYKKERKLRLEKLSRKSIDNRC